MSDSHISRSSNDSAPESLCSLVIGGAGCSFALGVPCHRLFKWLMCFFLKQKQINDDHIRVSMIDEHRQGTKVILQEKIDHTF